MTYSFDDARSKRWFGRLTGAGVHEYVIERGGDLTIETTLMPGG